MKGFKNTTRTQYFTGGDVGGYAKGGAAKPAMAKASKPAMAKAAKPAMAKAPVKKNEGGKIGKMPPIGESVKSGNRMSKMTAAAKMREMEERFGEKKRPSPADSAKSANRISAQEAAEARAMGVFKEGGKVRKYAEGGAAKPMGQTAAAYGANLREQVKAGKMTNAQAQAAQNAFVKQQMSPANAATLQSTSAKAAQPKPMGQTTAAYGANLRDQVKAGTMTNAQAQAAQNAFVKQQMSPANAATLQSALSKGVLSRDLVGTPSNPLTQEQVQNRERAIHSDPSSPFHHMYFPQTQPPMQPPMQPMQPPTQVNYDPRKPRRPRELPTQTGAQQMGGKQPDFAVKQPPMGRPEMPADFGHLPPGVPGFEQQYAQPVRPPPEMSVGVGMPVQPPMMQPPPMQTYTPPMKVYYDPYLPDMAPRQPAMPPPPMVQPQAPQGGLLGRHGAPSTQPSMPTTPMVQPPAIDRFATATLPALPPGFRMGGMAKRRPC